jgi:2Fe-2S ferredoxin
MITVHFAAAGCATAPRAVPCRPSQSLMQAALAAGIEGIVADCGGMATCGTCHVFVREPHAALLPPRSADEEAMLDYTAEPRRANSRLACQIAPGESLDGLTVDLPASQY